MELIRHFKSFPIPLRECAVTLGNFDGVHLGHQALLMHLKEQAKQRRIPAVAITFEPHPVEVLAPEKAPVRLNTLREKFTLMRPFELDACLCLHFDRTFANLSPQQFVEQVLIHALDVRYVLVGEDFRFGRQRAGDVDLLSTLGRMQGFEVETFSDFAYQGERVSSTRVRMSLTAGILEETQALLGRPYGICGRITQGAGRGRELGFPTANVSLAHRSLVVQGVYVVKVSNETLGSRWAVANVGYRPTFAQNKPVPWLELHLLDFDGSLYNQRLWIEFHHFLRAEQKFSGVEALKTQIQKDIEAAREYIDGVQHE